MVTNVSEQSIASIFRDTSTLKMEVTRSSETFVVAYKTRRRHNPGDHDLGLHRDERRQSNKRCKTENMNKGFSVRASCGSGLLTMYKVSCPLTCYVTHVACVLDVVAASRRGISIKHPADGAPRL